MGFESILEEIRLDRGHLSRNRKKRYRRLFLNGRDCLIVGATEESLRRALRLNQSTNAIFFTRSRAKFSYPNRKLKAIC